MAAVLDERDFTIAETEFLSLFFTGVAERSPVYCARDLISGKLWAFLAGSYSRTTITMREKFLRTVRDFSGSIEAYFDVINAATAAPTTELTQLTAKAEAFLSKWAVDYGHDSLKDSCTDRFAVERCTIRGAKVLERFQLGAYQEKSTRYVDFSTVRPMLEVMPDGGEELESIHHDSMELYTEMSGASAKQYMLKLATDSSITPTVAARTAQAKAFDVARYILGAYLPTAAGLTLPSRETSRAIDFFLGHKFPEIREIGRLMHEHGVFVNQALLTRVTPKPERILSRDLLIPLLPFTTNDTPLQVMDAFVSGSYCEGCKYEHGPVTLFTAERNSLMHPRYFAPAALLVEQHGTATSISAFVRDAINHGNTDAVRAIWEAALKDVGTHDEYPEPLDSVFLHVAGDIDFGAYRDLQRHRRGYQPDINVDSVYEYSEPFVDWDALENGQDLRNRYTELMARMTSLRERLPE
jgi:thymidylate synthase ThyX